MNMKKLCCGILLAAGFALLAGCGSAAGNISAAVPGADDALMVEPLESTLYVNHLEDSNFAASFKASDVRLNDDGALCVAMQVWDYERFDPVDIASLKVGDTILINGKKVCVDSIEMEGQYAVINGGLEEGGFDLFTDEDGEYHEVIMDAGPRYFPVGEVTIPVAQEFVFTDNSDPENQGKIMYAGDFLIAMEQSDEEFNANATVVRTENGKIMEITRNYMP